MKHSVVLSVLRCALCSQDCQTEYLGSELYFQLLRSVKPDFSFSFGSHIIEFDIHTVSVPLTFAPVVAMVGAII